MKILGTPEWCTRTVRKRSSPRTASALSARFVLEESPPMNSTISDSLAFKRAETYRVTSCSTLGSVSPISIASSSSMLLSLSSASMSLKPRWIFSPEVFKPNAEHSLLFFASTLNAHFASEGLFTSSCSAKDTISILFVIMPEMYASMEAALISCTGKISFVTPLVFAVSSEYLFANIELKISIAFLRISMIGSPTLSLRARRSSLNFICVNFFATFRLPPIANPISSPFSR
mmetsp:Transcript_10400/g.29765  ORF Transcript_10400/g.29765 Transcript_10400/m.29765 type:complete len:232 (-) Transcript_10400:1366-2061(-)